MQMSQNNKENDRETFWERGRGSVRHDGCDYYSWSRRSSVLQSPSLTLFPNCKCAQFRYPSSREHANPPIPSGARSTCVSVRSSRSLEASDWLKRKSIRSLVHATETETAGVRTAAGPRAAKPRRRRIWGCGGSPSGSAPYPATAGDRAGESRSSRGCWSHPGGGTLLPSPGGHRNIRIIRRSSSYSEYLRPFTALFGPSSVIFN